MSVQVNSRTWVQIGIGMEIYLQRPTDSFNSWSVLLSWCVSRSSWNSCLRGLTLKLQMQLRIENELMNVIHQTLLLKATSGSGNAVSNRETRTRLSQWRGDTPKLKVLASCRCHLCIQLGSCCCLHPNENE